MYTICRLFFFIICVYIYIYTLLLEIQLSIESGWGPIIRINPGTFLCRPNLDLDFQGHISWSFCVIEGVKSLFVLLILVGLWTMAV